ncbi:daptide-type RiPP [Yimella sp. NH-Cas1]|uniref:daptide-type RiPP n=1 Tax=Yimella sp. NH-Cas1 TaxID=2917726 RepID=UPI001EFB5D2D|nr:daptide-type RiPP [Yimella sp. NH-Cas1]MCG8654523.1 hypothetical protein [Yimella sp. NH-Cas1]
MDTMSKTMVDDQIESLELGLQELESLEAPGFWTTVGVSVGVTAASAAAYGSYAVSVATVAT